MSKVKGTLVKADLGMGSWVLEGDDGTRYQLDGKVPSDLAGKRVVVRGEAVEGFGFAMTGGPTLKVSKVSAD